jgi:predicted regulator of Ras-like GTPase activity (Roadblock/LC7/MglB family)
MSATFSAVLDGLTRVPGVRSALLVAADDGLVIAESSMADVDTAAVAALAASLAARLSRAVIPAGYAVPRSLHLEATGGGLMAAPAGEGLLLVAVIEPDANVGLLRLALRDAAQRVG